MEIKAQDVKALRDATGAGMMDAKKALVEAGGDIEKAKQTLREKGIARAGKLAERSAEEGVVETYLHQPDPSMPPKVGVMIELNCATDFVAKTDKFRALAREVALHIAAARPVAVSREEIPAELVDKEREIFANQARESGKPEAIIDKIVEGKLKDFYAQNALLDQAYVRDPQQTVGDLLTNASAELGEPVKVRRFARFRVGGE